MKTVLLRSSCLTNSGYGVHARQVARYLLGLEKRGLIRLHVQPLPWGITSWLIDENREDGLIGEIIRHAMPPSVQPDACVMLQLPDEFYPPNTPLEFHGNVNIGITAAVETDRCNPSWISACNRLDALVVPSQHTLKTLTSTGNITCPTYVIGESYPDVYRSDSVPQSDFDFSTPFNFLIVGQLTGNNPENDRKNIFFTLKYLCDVFADDPEVGIVIKTNSGRNTKIDRQLCQNVFNQALAEIRPRGFPKVHLIHGDLTNDEMLALYRHPKIKGFINLSHGEGFGLPNLEAAAAGLPVIATNWSAHIEYMNLGKFIPVNYVLKPIHPSRVDGRIFIEGSQWAYPSEEDFKKKVKKFRQSPGTPKEWALELKKTILQKYSFETIASEYDKSLLPLLT